jgi:hypothetical protein
MTLSQIMEQVDVLTLDEQIELKHHLEERIEANARLPKVVRRRNWSELVGIVDAPLTGEDAQAWISRNRSDEDERISRWERG